MDCGVPFCQGSTGCPVEPHPGMERSRLSGRWQDALKALHTTNNFPEFTGRLCPAPCEGACVLASMKNLIHSRDRMEHHRSRVQ